MRFLMSVFCSLVLLILVGLDSPQFASRVALRVSSEVDDLLVKKEIWVSATKLIDRRDIDRLLPLEESIPWWLAHIESIETSLLSHPLISKVSVESCHDSWWGCFSITIVERQPSYLIVVGKQGWLVGDDGGVLTPLPAQRADAILRGDEPAEFLGKRVPVIQGLLAEDESPDMVRARLGHAKRSIQILEEELKGIQLPSEVEEGVGDDVVVERLSFRFKSDVKARFRGLGFIVTFEVRPEHWEEGLHDQAKRLRRLLIELGPRVAEVKEIDLAFNSLAVVRPALRLAEE